MPTVGTLHSPDNSAAHTVKQADSADTGSLTRSSVLTFDTAGLIDKALGGKIDLQSEANHDKFVEAIQWGVVHDTTVHAIKDLNSTLQSIKQAFRKIRENLQRFDNEGYCKNGVVLQLSLHDCSR